MIYTCTPTYLILGAISKPTGTPPGIDQYREQMSSIVGFLFADFILYPIETVLLRLHLQGTRTIIDNLGKTLLFMKKDIFKSHTFIIFIN